MNVAQRALAKQRGIGRPLASSAFSPARHGVQRWGHRGFPIGGLGPGGGLTYSSRWVPQALMLMQPTFNLAAAVWEDWSEIFRLHDPNDYGGNKAHYFEALLRTTNAAVPAYARLYNITLAAAVLNALVMTNSTDVVRLRSSGFSLPVGDNEYKAQIGQPA